MELDEFEVADQPRLMPPRWFRNGAIGAVLMVTILPTVYFAFSLNEDRFMGWQFNSLETPSEMKFVGRWLEQTGFGSDDLRRAYVTNLELQRACEVMGGAVADWSSRQVDHPYTGSHPEDDRCLVLYERRSILSLFQARSVHVNGLPYSRYQELYGVDATPWDEPNPELPPGYTTVVVVTLRN